MVDYLYNFPNSTLGYDQVFNQLVQEVPILTPAILIIVWTFVFFSGMVAQMNRSGYGDAPLWATLAFLSSMIATLLMSLTSGVVNPIILGFVVSGTIFCGLWFFLSSSRFE